MELQSAMFTFPIVRVRTNGAFKILHRQTGKSSVSKGENQTPLAHWSPASLKPGVVLRAEDLWSLASVTSRDVLLFSARSIKIQDWEFALFLCANRSFFVSKITIRSFPRANCSRRSLKSYRAKSNGSNSLSHGENNKFFGANRSFLDSKRVVWFSHKKRATHSCYTWLKSNSLSLAF